MSLVRVLGTLSSLIVFFTDSEEGFLLAPQQSVLQPGVGIHPQMSSVRLSGATRREFREKEKVIQIISSVFTFLASVCVCVCVICVCVCAVCVWVNSLGFRCSLSGAETWRKKGLELEQNVCVLLLLIRGVESCSDFATEFFLFCTPNFFFS